jgi:hypothetical protein
MRVEALQAPSLVAWACVAHTRSEEWTGSTVRFELADRGPRACGLDFRHIGMPSDLVAEGWDHFLASLSGYLEHGTGTPFGTLPEAQRPAPSKPCDRPLKAPRSGSVKALRPASSSAGATVPPDEVSPCGR